MRSYFLTILSFLFIFSIGCAPDIDQKIINEYPEFLILTAKNETNLLRSDEAIVLDVLQLKTKAVDFNPNAFVIFSKGIELASQANDLNRDGNPDQIVAIMDFKPGETKTLNLRYATSGVKPREYTKRTQAELSIKVGGKFVDRKYEGGTFQNVQFLRVPPEHTDHSLYIRYEGPGWESDKVGYRFYLDWRNATDIYGKKVPDMVLQNVGQDGFDSYHEMSDWGADILKVGESLGIGSIATWHENKANRVAKTDSVTCAIVANGIVYSQIKTIYHGWQAGASKVNLTSDLSITAGSRLTRTDLTIEGELENICTGLAKHENTVYLEKQPEAPTGWGYIALWGNQSLAGEDDELGMAVLYQDSQFIQLAEDDLNHVVILKPENSKVSYYFLAAWVQEPDGIKTRDAFIDYLNKTVQQLNHPILVNYVE
ncbi:MAG: DUF4861 domain-containing protein [bacterium]|jgi:hypothetical protein|nr:DUF4861 domain-containing protein [bacterium]